MSSLRLFCVALVPVLGIRLQAPGNSNGKTMAGSFGGGGCLSFVSQIGYLRGLLADDLDGDGITLTTLASSSGGSWAVGGLFDLLASSGNRLTNIYAQGELKKSENESHWENELGRWCMYHQMDNAGRSRDLWNVEMMACAQCASKPGGCGPGDHHILDPIFGAAKKCIVTDAELKNAKREGLTPEEEVQRRGWSEAQALQNMPAQAWDQFSNIASKWNDDALRYASYPFPLPGDEKDVPVLGPAFPMHRHFFPEDESRKLSDISDVFTDGNGGKTYWSVFWSGLTPNNTVTRGSSGSAATSDYNMGDAMYMSSDAISALEAASIIWQSVNDPDPTKCLAYAKIIDAQTQHDRYPWPFETAPGLPPIQFPRNWRHAGVDGAIMDNNAVGEAVRLMDSLPQEERPPSLTSLITGAVNGMPADTDLDIDNVILYFMEKVEWKSFFNPIRGMIEGKKPDTCTAVLNRQVKNPNYFFKYKGLVRVPGYESCNAAVMLSRRHNETCGNFAYQADTTGSIFVREAKVTRNDFWGIKGGWNVNIMFTILDSNPAADHWKLDVYNDDSVALKKLQHFPVLAGNPGAGNTLEKISPFHAFALMNYNSYKGYMAHCALLYYQTNGENKCNYCKRNARDCEKWLPFLSK